MQSFSGLFQRLSQSRNAAYDARKVLQCYIPQIQQGSAVAQDVYAQLVDACGIVKSPSEAKRVHQHLREHSSDLLPNFANQLISMYGRCGSGEEAKRVFDSIQRPSVVSWNHLITAYAQSGNSQEAIHLFNNMKHPSEYSAVAVLKAFNNPDDLAEAKLIHSRIKELRLDRGRFVSTALLSMYGKCGCIDEARRIFDELQERNVVSWNAMIAVYAQNEMFTEAMQLFSEMQEKQRDMINRTTFITIFKACVRPEAAKDAKHLHQLMIESGFDKDVVSGTSVIEMYGKCGCFEEARRVFEEMTDRNSFTWNTMMRAYHSLVTDDQILEFYKQMQAEKIPADASTFIAVLSACSSTGDLKLGMKIHAAVAESELESDMEVTNALLDMYATCGSLEDACVIFSIISPKDACAWESMAAASLRHGHADQAQQIYRLMNLEGFKRE